MTAQASAGRDRKKDLRTYCYSLRLVASNDDDAATLAALNNRLTTIAGLHWLKRVLAEEKKETE